ncbi:tyrosine-type recombinase/integrase [Amphritea atlantica]|uniref:Tyrosine-type recombinase/integrase n=1 Tax=Amphritea atlantica TaxID=355243 RepID=A0ABY5GUI4_9GAMM|nr:tyrosine-type recombinase/integrase [Amphritea atlantica]
MTTHQGSKPLTSKTVENMKPGSPDRSDIGEYRGLRVSRGKSGRTSFYYRYRSPLTGKLVQMNIGRFPEMSLAEARNQFLILKEARLSGMCPANEKKKQIEAEATVKNEEALKASHQGFSVKKLIDLYLEEYIEDRKTPDGKLVLGARKPKGQAETRRTLESDPIRGFGSLEANELTRQMVVEHIMGIVNRGANVQAGNVLRELTAAYEYAIGLGRLPPDFANPALLAKASLRQAKVKLTSQKGKRALSDRELKKLLEWLPGSIYTPTQKNIIRFTLWTGCRTGEVCVAEWKDIDMEKGTFHIRESKTGAERSVQLPKQAVEFLRFLRLNTEKYLFPSTKTKLPIQQKQLTEQAWRMRKNGKMLEIDPWVPHDLRRTVRTGLSRLRCPNEIAEAVLGHARGGIEGTYDLHRYEAECCEWLQKWADHLDGLI